MLGVHVDGDAPAIVLNGDGPIAVELDLDALTVPGEGLVNRVVDNLENAVVEAAFVGVANVHVGTLADAFEAFEFFNFGGVVRLR
jgi:hypothetical protein